MLEKTSEDINKYDMLIIFGDFNAKIRKEGFVKSVTDMHSLYNDTSPNGQRLCQMAENTALRIISTSFPHKDIHKAWRSPDGCTINQIDHVLVNRRRRSSIFDVRVCSYANCDSDHYLNKIKVRRKITSAFKVKGEKSLNWNIEKLKEEEIIQDLQTKVNDYLQKSYNKKDINETWRNIKYALIESTKQVVGITQHSRNDNWFNQECINVINAKNEARRATLRRNTRGTQGVYRELRRKAKKICRHKKKEALNRRLEDINKEYRTHNTRRMYELINWERRGYQPRLGNIKNKMGKMLTEKDQIANRWTEHFGSTFN